MSIKKMSARSIAAGGLVAGLYIALTALFAPMSFGAIQFRVSEALTLLPILSPAAVPGLFVGCLLSNIILGAPWQDIVFGSLLAYPLSHKVCTFGYYNRCSRLTLVVLQSYGEVSWVSYHYVGSFHILHHQRANPAQH